jgi:LuxR family maltose regulon positive regulatory protein
MFKEAIETAVLVLKRADTLKCFDVALKLRAVLSAAEFALGEKGKAMETIAPALRLGEKQGYVRAFIDVGELIAPILRHAIGCEIHSAYCSKLLRAANFFAAENRNELSERELEVLKLVATGRSNAQIAESLYLSSGTVKRHIYNISSKLGASNRMESVLIAKRIGIL